MPTATDFRNFAQTCTQIANNIGAPASKAALLTMAQVWLDLAAEADQLTKLVQEADTAFEVRAPEIARTAPLWATDLAQKSA